MLEAGGFTVRTGVERLEALDRTRRAESDEIDMVLSDVTMPGMTGIDLSYQIRELYPSMPVAIVSGDVSELERSIIGRADVPFIKKPFHAESLFSAVKEAIQSTRLIVRVAERSEDLGLADLATPRPRFARDDNGPKRLSASSEEPDPPRS